MKSLVNPHKSLLKSKKAKLINRINQAKTLKEVEGLERTLQYYPVLRENYEWDYDFLLSLIEFKLKRMREYFWTHNIVENEKRNGDYCNKLINILHAGYGTDIIDSEDLKKKNIYVNTRNVNRFFNPEHLSFIQNEKLKDKYYLPVIRETKAKALFWKYLYYKIEYLWD